MIKSLVKLSEENSRVVDIVKAKYGLKDKSEAINLVIKIYEEDFLEPELRPEFIKKIRVISKEDSVKIKDFDKEFNLLE